MCSPPLGRAGRSAGPLLLVLLLAAAVLVACSGEQAVETPASRPNVVVVVTDDQRVDGMDHMPQTSALFEEQGTTFTDSVASYPLCCPNRATLMTGQYPHNHGVLDNLPPYGAVAFDSETALPAALQDAGYRTSHVGKWLNGYGETVPAEPLPGWDEWWTFVDPSTYDAYQYRISTNDGVLEEQDRPAAHGTDAIQERAVDQVRTLAEGEDPYYLQVDFVAPHSMAGSSPPGAPVVQDRFADAPVDVVVDEEALLEEDLTDKPTWLGIVQQRSRAEAEAALAPLAAATARSLLGVDEAVAALAEAVDQTGEDTLFVFTSDNGLMMGEHGLFGKVVPYEPSSRVPLLVRGAGFPEGATVQAPVASIDLATTITALAGADPLVEEDGLSLYGIAQDPPPADGDQRAILLANGPASPALPHYDGVRVDGWVYIEWSTGELELYDLEADPSQLQSRHTDVELAEVREHLAEVLDQLRDCAGETCQVTTDVPRPDEG